MPSLGPADGRPLAAADLRRRLRVRLRRVRRCPPRRPPRWRVALEVPLPATVIGAGRQQPRPAGVAARLFWRRPRAGVGVATERPRVEREGRAAGPGALRALLRGRSGALLAGRLPAGRAVVAAAAEGGDLVGRVRAPGAAGVGRAPASLPLLVDVSTVPAEPCVLADVPALPLDPELDDWAVALELVVPVVQPVPLPSDRCRLPQPLPLPRPVAVAVTAAVPVAIPADPPPPPPAPR